MAIQWGGARRCCDGIVLFFFSRIADRLYAPSQIFAISLFSVVLLLVLNTRHTVQQEEFEKRKKSVTASVENKKSGYFSLGLLKNFLYLALLFPRGKKAEIRGCGHCYQAHLGIRILRRAFGISSYLTNGLRVSQMSSCNPRKRLHFAS